MWTLDRAMDASSQRPWTPPDIDPDATLPSDYFAHVDRPASPVHRWSSSSSPDPTRCDTPTKDQRARPRPKPVSTSSHPAPYTPTRSFNPHAAHAPQYPYTPDSSRILRRSTELPVSPVPWETADNYAVQAVSPVQDALSSCIAHFETLIQTRQPDEEQMEFIVDQFEAMAVYLGAQAKAHHPVTERRHEPSIVAADENEEEVSERVASSPVSVASPPVSEEYVAQVGQYIQGVRKHIADLRMRLDEVKMLNGIQLDVIDDLRRQMKSVSHGMRSTLDIPKVLLMPLDDDEELYATSEDESDHEVGRPGNGNEAQRGKRGEGTSELEDGRMHNMQLDGTHDDHDVDDMDDYNDFDDNNDDALSPRDSLIISQPSRKHTHTYITIIRPPPARPGFWSSFAAALDSFGDLFLED